MGYMYEHRKRPPIKENATRPADAAYHSAGDAPKNANQAMPAAGSSFDLDGAMQARMSNTFGDLSAVRDYTPPAQKQDTVRTGVHTGPVTHAISDASPSPSVAGPMQAKRRDTDAKEVKQMQKEGENYNGMYATPDYAGFDKLDPEQWETKTHEPGFTKIFGKKNQTYKVRNLAGLTIDQSKIDRSKSLKPDYRNDFDNKKNYRKGMAELEKKLEQKYGNLKKSKDFEYLETWHSDVKRPANPVIKGVNDREAPDAPVNISGLGIGRMFEDLVTDRNRGFNMDAKEMEAFFDDLMAPKKKGLSDKEQLDANKRFDKAVLKYKGILYDDMRHNEKTYGRLLSQMHPQDIAPQMGTGFALQKYYRFGQDAAQMLKDGRRYFDMENNEDDKHFSDLTDYYFGTQTRQMRYIDATQYMRYTGKKLDEYVKAPEADLGDAVEKNIGGPQMSPKLYKRYLNNLHKQAQSEPFMRGRLFGRFLPEKGMFTQLKKDSKLDFKPEKAPEPKPEVIPDDPLNTSMIDYMPKKKWMKKKHKDDLFD